MFDQSAFANLEAGLFLVSLFIVFVLVMASGLTIVVMRPIFLLIDKLLKNAISTFYRERVAKTAIPIILKTCGIVIVILAVPTYFVGGSMMVLHSSYQDGDVYLKQHADSNTYHASKGGSLAKPFDTIVFEGYESDFHMGKVWLYDQSWADRKSKEWDENYSSGIQILYDDSHMTWLHAGREGGFGDVDFQKQFDRPGKIYILKATSDELWYTLEKMWLPGTERG